jgi:hypothetical protein
MADPNKETHHEPAEVHDDAHAVSDHGHGHGHGAAPTFDIIPEGSGADSFLNFLAWLGFVGLLVFSVLVVTAKMPEHEAAHEAEEHAAPAAH